MSIYPCPSIPPGRIASPLVLASPSEPPITTSSSTQHQPAVTIQHRELIEVLARAAAEADESDAFSISNIFKAVKTVIGIGKTVFDGRCAYASSE